MELISGNSSSISCLSGDPSNCLNVINKTNNKNILNIVHQNIQGLMGKELELELFMNCNNIDILCITEHWLKDHQFMFSFNNHQVASSFSRVNLIRGGSLIFVHNNLKFKERKDIVSLSVERVAEIACIELEQFIVLSVYRPPCALYDTFEKILEDVLLKISNTNKTVAVCGDFNINLLEKSTIVNRFLILLKSYNLYNTFLEPTRITATSATCIDNVFTNMRPTSYSIINLLDSDHCGQLVSFTKSIVKANRKTVNFVPVTSCRLELFKNNLIDKLPSLPYHSNPDQAYSLLFNLINSQFKKVFTSRSISVSDRVLFSDWATPGIFKSRTRLFELYNERRHDHSEKFREYVKSYSKTFKRACSAAKSLHIKNKIQSSTNKIKTTWNIINSEIGRTTVRNNDFHLKINDVDVRADMEVATEFESFFTNIPVLTTKTLSSSSSSAYNILKDSVAECETSFEFTVVSVKDILDSFKDLEVKKSTDLWGLSVQIISSIIQSISPFLAIVFNSCVASGVFPDLMKLSKVIPLFKSGSTTDPTNFRPISILPTLSKIFEKIILKQMLKHFNSQKLFHSKQFGFTKGRSTTDAGVELLKNIYEAWENSQDALGIFCDLSKAFDCVCHDTLIKKLHHYGIRDKALRLLSSYLDNRVQRVDVNGKISKGSVVTMGVPQGSILGPFLFLIYINDLPFCVRDEHKILLFADDTSLVFKVKRQLENFDQVNLALSKVVHWFNINNLLLNPNKTKLVKFSTPNVRQLSTNVQLNGVELDPVESTVFLGITVDAKLQWGPHINKLSGKLSSAAYAVKKIRQITDVATARIVYFSYFHSLMTYGILLWGSCADINSIFVLQKRAVRAIYNLGPRVSLREKFKEINILTVTSQYIFENLLYVHKNESHFVKLSDVHSRNTRNKNNLTVHGTRLHRISNSFMGQCIRFYNKLPMDVRKLPIKKFKFFIKSKLLTKGYYKISDYLNDRNAWD